MTAKIQVFGGQKIFFLSAGLVLLLLMIHSECVANAEGAIDPDQKGVRINSAGRIKPADILSSIEEGGLMSPQSLDDLKQDDNNPLAQDAPAPEQTFSEPEQVPVDINANSLTDLESLGGLSSKPQNDSEKDALFKTVTKFLERVVFRGSVEFTKTPEFDQGMNISGTPTFNKDTAGYAVIKKDNQSVDVEFEQKYESTPIVTATLSLQQYDDPEVTAAAEDLLLVSEVNFIVTKTTQKGFEIMMDHIADSDIPFSWHALSVNDPETSKKKGATLKNATLPFRFFYSGPDSQDLNSSTNKN